MVALGEVTIYLGEKCWGQVGGGAEEFTVPHSPPWVIESEGATNLGEEGIEATAFLDWTRDYLEWWATQTYGPMGEPVDLPVATVQPPKEPAPPFRRGRKRRVPPAKPDLMGLIPEVVPITDFVGGVTKEPLPKAETLVRWVPPETVT